MNNKVKNQHFIPRMYLKRFATENNRMSVWKLDDDLIMTRQRPENFAAVRYFYDTNENELKKALSELIEIYPERKNDIDFTDDQFVEKYLSRMEADIKNVIDEIILDNNLLCNESYKNKIIIFIHDLAYRTEEYRNKLNSIRNQTVAYSEKMNVSLNKNEILPKDSQLYQLVGLYPIIQTMNMLIENYNWYIGSVTGQTKLIISDNPAMGIMLGFNDICFPLCSEKAIIMRIKDSEAPIISKDMPKGNKVDLSEISVIKYNIVQYSFAKRFVFGDKYSLTSLEKITKTKREE